MNFFITKQFILEKVEKRETGNFYTLIDSHTLQRFQSIGTQTNIDIGIEEKDVVEMEINIKTTPEPIQSKSSKIKYMQIVKSYLTQVRKVTTFVEL
jgi:hypothetical protein